MLLRCGCCLCFVYIWLACRIGWLAVYASRLPPRRCPKFLCRRSGLGSPQYAHVACCHNRRLQAAKRFEPTCLVTCQHSHPRRLRAATPGLGLGAGGAGGGGGGGRVPFIAGAFHLGRASHVAFRLGAAWLMFVSVMYLLPQARAW